MKEFAAGDTSILLARVGDRFHAVSANCPHYGASLAEGALCGTHIVCPLHHAVFNVVNGDLEEPPALDALVSYEVRVEGERVLVRVPEENADPTFCPDGPGVIPVDSRQFVILGAGAAGYAAAQTLREEGFRGSIVMITREDRAPYDRPNLSKDYLHGHAEAGVDAVASRRILRRSTTSSSLLNRGSDARRLARQDDRFQGGRNDGLRRAARCDGWRAGPSKHSRFGFEERLCVAQFCRCGHDH